MCGIIGILGQTPVAPLLVDGLKRLEYRGYDSAGIAVIEGGHLASLRAEGKLRNLEAKLAGNRKAGRIGIGHTRWATHGVPSERNAHPHLTERVAVVHNGIFENFRELRLELEAAGRVFSSDTDTEVMAHLVTANLADGMAPLAAVQAALARVRGAFALAFLFEGEDDLVIGARRGSPLAIGWGAGEMFLGSDGIALGPFTDEITYLDEGDVAVVTRAGAVIHDETGRVVERPVTRTHGNTYVADKGNHRHFMVKEIHEQPEVTGRTLAHYLDLAEGRARPPEGIDFSRIDRLSITACGTAFYAGFVAKYWFERFARLPVDIDIASEFRYREQPLSKDGLAIVISQSGETADTLASLRYARVEGQRIAAVVNVRESTIAREADVVLPILAGPEIGVASTKAFTAQLAVLAATAIAAGRARGSIDDVEEARLVAAFSEVPRLMHEALRLEGQIEALARDLAKVKHCLYLGRGTSYPIALEGALKLKEISYIHAEGYAAGELKHGPIALIDEEMPVVVIAPFDRVFEKTVSNMQEVAARGGRIILVTDRKGAEAAAIDAAATIILPEMPASVTPLVYSIPVQLLAYHTAVFMGTDVDQPRNLAKSVTVE
ncbi:glutamine--fructose-6-phosphate transaminase (isomerizing) [Kaistia geumhonensis]|uniref:Glutamine--fructose-6-phosphate aminotransferase [isomerizing] n=1 Tax=Kaistia geumhonensis TaxID=410839 RepID=A0ABU0M1U5_9HYPH|nr:glutamine--fructose-6-phosphate transaminase (isomerizing) [Kaistia geumhonensis]MCX5479847.1 glutamine--fructose-6-phosphate transaminase (isomerizing) [Kaistia geumhonensis]MDQ0514927.1 glucosamine--fructose-6-phosphate aminotransferase (isomerizing) [Kaistia geumhonensis]